MDETTQRVCKIIRITAADWLLSDQTIKKSHSLRNDLGFDSLAIVHLQVAIEEEFEFRFDPVNTDFMAIFDTVGRLSDYLVTRDISEEIF